MTLKKSLQAAAIRYRRLAGPLRMFHYRLWRSTGVPDTSGLRPELRMLSAAARRSGAEHWSVPAGGPRILFFTFRGWNTHAMWDALLAHALRLRGADVQFFTCGGRLPVCDYWVHTLAPPMPCNECAPYVNRAVSTLRLPLHEMRDFVSAAERAELHHRISALAPEEYEHFTFDGLPLGQIVRPSVQWFMLSGTPVFDREMQEAYRKFLISGAIITRAAERMIEKLAPNLVYSLNGIFFAERIAIELARRRGIPFITHEGGFMPDSQVFARNGFAPYYELDDVWKVYGQRPLAASEERRLDEYLDARAQGRRDVGTYYPTIESDVGVVARQLGLDRTKPIVSLFTNVDWDTACFASNAAFASMAEWLEHTIRHFAARPGVQLIVRIHPAEVRLPFLEPREPSMRLIERLFSGLPAHIRLIPPDSKVSSYALMDLSTLGLVYTSTTGMEMALREKPVITAGRAYYGRKGFTFDAQSPADYDELLSHAAPISPEQIDLARRYACLFFFRHHLRFPLTTTSEGSIHLNFATLDALKPGREPYLDLLCDAILNDQPFLDRGAL